MLVIGLSLRCKYVFWETIMLVFKISSFKKKVHYLWDFMICEIVIWQILSCVSPNYKLQNLALRQEVPSSYL